MTDTELRELDAWIAENVMGYAWLQPIGGRYTRFYLVSPNNHKDLKPEFVFHRKSYRDEDIENAPRYTTDPAAAMEVLKKCSEKYSIKIGFDVNGKWFVSHYDAKFEGVIRAETLELAICLFAKKLFGGGK